MSQLLQMLSPDFLLHHALYGSVVVGFVVPLASAIAHSQSVLDMVEEVKTYVPGYRLKQALQFEHIGSNKPLHIPGLTAGDRSDFTGLKVSIFLEVEGAAHYLPAYAGNLDIMTSAALRTAERMAATLRVGAPA